MPKAKKIDYKKLGSLCEIMCTADECAEIMGIDYDTLNRTLNRDGHLGFEAYSRRHYASGKMSTRRAQFRGALDGNASMLIWLGKQWLGQRGPERTDSGDDLAEILRQIMAT